MGASRYDGGTDREVVTYLMTNNNNPLAQS